MPNIIKGKQTEQITGSNNDTESSKNIMHEEDEIITNIWRMANQNGINIISKDSNHN